VRNYGSKQHIVPAHLTREEQELYKYVAKALKHGMDKPRIEEILLRTGWKKETVEKVIKAITKNK